MINRRAFLISLSAALTSCGGDDNVSSGASAEPVQVTPEKNNTIIAIGDSIGAGYNASVNFPSVVQSLTGIQTINNSVSGRSAEHGASEARQMFQRYNPKYMIALLGTNNARGNGAGVEGAINSIRFLARIAQENGVIGVFGTLPIITNNSTENDKAAAISNGIRGVGNGARIADIRAAIGAGDISDGLHPNNRGQQIIGQLFAAQIY